MRTNGVFHGLIIAAALIVYFLLMKLLGLEKVFSLRLFNFVILVGGIYLAQHRAVVKRHTSKTYFEGLLTGIRATVIGVGVFLLFMALYVEVLDPAFVKVLEESNIWGQHLSLPQAAVAIIIEGMISGVVISFSLMQLFKPHLPELEDEET